MFMPLFQRGRERGSFEKGPKTTDLGHAKTQAYTAKHWKSWNLRQYVSCPCSEMDVLSNVSASKEKGTPFEHKTKRTDESPTRLARLRTFGTFSGRMPSQTVQAQESKHKMELQTKKKGKPKRSSCLGPLTPCSETATLNDSLAKKGRKRLG